MIDEEDYGPPDLTPLAVAYSWTNLLQLPPLDFATRTMSFLTKPGQQDTKAERKITELTQYRRAEWGNVFASTLHDDRNSRD